MAGKIVEYRGLEFEVWEKSLRLVGPKYSPTVASYADLTDPEAAKRAMDDFIAIMNLGIEIVDARPRWIG